MQPSGQVIEINPLPSKEVMKTRTLKTELASFLESERGLVATQVMKTVPREVYNPSTYDKLTALFSPSKRDQLNNKAVQSARLAQVSPFTEVLEKQDTLVYEPGIRFLEHQLAFARNRHEYLFPTEQATAYDNIVRLEMALERRKNTQEDLKKRLENMDSLTDSDRNNLKNEIIAFRRQGLELYKNLHDTEDPIRSVQEAYAKHTPESVNIKSTEEVFDEGMKNLLSLLPCILKDPSFSQLAHMSIAKPFDSISSLDNDDAIKQELWRGILKSTYGHLDDVMLERIKKSLPKELLEEIDQQITQLISDGKKFIPISQQKNEIEKEMEDIQKQINTMKQTYTQTSYVNTFLNFTANLLLALVGAPIWMKKFPVEFLPEKSLKFDNNAKEKYGNLLKQKETLGQQWNILDTKSGVKDAANNVYRLTQNLSIKINTFEAEKKSSQKEQDAILTQKDTLNDAAAKPLASLPVPTEPLSPEATRKEDLSEENSNKNRPS